MGRFFASGYSNTTCSTVAKEVIQLLSGSSVVTTLHEVVISHITTVSYPIEYSIAFAATTGVAGATQAVTPLAMAGSTQTGNVYGVAGATNATGLSYVYREAVNSLNNWHYLPTPECRPKLKPAQRLVIRRDICTAECPITVNITFEEEG